MGVTVSSNATGLRIAIEDSFKVVSGNEVWDPMEPNSYADFGGTVTKIARTPIQRSRQRKKGVTVDVDAAGGFNNDFTQENLRKHLPSFFFRDYDLSGEEVVTGINLDAGNPDEYTVASNSGFLVNNLIKGFGFTNAANRAVNKVAALTATTVEVATGLLVTETPPAGAYIKVVGHEFAAADINIVNTNGFPGFNSVSNFDFTTLPIKAGQWVFIGGDLSANRFAVAEAQFARIHTVAVGRLEFDKIGAAMLDETGTGKSIRVFFGDYISNPEDAIAELIRSSQMERELSDKGFEYLLGCVGNTLNFNIVGQNKVTVDIGYVCADFEHKGPGERKGGTFPDVTEADAFNTSSDFSRLRMAKDSSLNTDLFVHITAMTIQVSNGASPTKVVGELGAVDITPGDFVVNGSVTALFSEIAAIAAVRDNDSVTLDLALVKNNAGWMFDLPLLTLGDGRLNITKDQPITLPLSFDAAEHPDLNVTLTGHYFPYLPDVAED